MFRTASRSLTVVALTLFVVSAAAFGQTTTAPDRSTTRPATSPATSPTTSRPANADTPSASSIMQRAVRAMGGRTNIDAIKSMHTQTDVKVPGAPPMTVESFWERPNKAAMHQMTFGTKVTQATNGKISWMWNPMKNAFELLPVNAATEIYRNANAQMSLMDMDKEKMPANTPVEHTRFDDRDCYLVHVPGPEPMTAYFDTSSGLPAGLSAPSPSGESKMLFRDWREINGVKFAHTTILVDADPRLQGNVEMKTTKVTVNDVDASNFTPPDEIMKLAADRDARPATSPSTPPSSGGERKLSPMMEQAANNIRSMTDPDRLLQMKSMLSTFRDQLSAEEQGDLDYVLELIDTRIAELDS